MSDEAIARQIEPQVRALIADVIAAKAAATEAVQPALAAQLARIEHQLGGLLPPVRGTLHVPLDVARALQLPNSFTVTG